MFTKIAAASTLVAFAGVVFGADLGIDSPSQLRTCIPVQLNWHGGEAPYYLQILQGGSTSEQIESLLDGTDDTSYTWTVDLDAGTEVTLGITDSSGDSAYSSVLTITQGSSDCSSSGSDEESSAASEDDSSSTAAAESSAAATSSGSQSSAAESGSSAAAESGASSDASSAQSSSAAEPTSSSSSSSNSEDASETESAAPEDNDDDSSAVTLKHAGMASVVGALAFVALA